MAGNGISRRTFLYTTAALSATATLGTVLGGTDPAFAAINSRVAWDFFIAKGLTAVQAAGVLGNLAQESNIDPLAQEPGGPGRGIAQWSAGGRWDATPNANATWYAASTGQSVWSLRAQLEFIWWELTNIPAYGLAELKGAATIAAATIVFQNRFERCGTCHQATRISYATNYYNQYAGTVTPPALGQVFETAHDTGWQPLPVGHNGLPLLATASSAVLRADGTKIIYTVRDGRLYEAASNTGWLNLQVPHHDQVTAASAIAYDGATVVYTIRAGAVYEARAGNWQPLLVGHNGQAIHATAISAITRTDGTKVIYTARDGHAHEAASNTQWRNLRVPNLTHVNTITAINTNTNTILYTH